MTLFLTSTQKEAAKFPDKIDILKTKNKRGLINTYEEQRNYNLTMTGALGENILYDYICKYGKKDWKVIRNLWLDYDGIFEIDLLLLTPYKVHAFENKHYDGDLIIDGHRLSIDGRDITTSCIEQTRKNGVKLKSILGNIPLEMINVFSNADNQVINNTVHEHTTVVPRHSMKKHIITINEEYGPPLDHDRVLALLDKYEMTSDPFRPEPVDKNELTRMRKGYICDRCGSGQIATDRTKAECLNCHYIDSRDVATLRAICDYGVLTYDKDFSLRDMCKFFAGQASRNYLRRILQKYFVAKGSGSHIKYENLKLPYERVKGLFRENLLK